MAKSLQNNLRKIHYWLSVIVVLPALLIFVSGILLQVKKQVEWIQPVTQSGTRGAPTLSFDQILESARTVPEAGIESWSDIKRLDVRPGLGITKIRGASDLEIQIDNSSAKVLQVAKRRSDWVESLHDGSYFSAPVKYGVFLSTGVFLLVMLLSGIYLFFAPLARKRKKARTSQSD